MEEERGGEKEKKSLEVRQSDKEKIKKELMDREEDEEEDEERIDSSSGGKRKRRRRRRKYEIRERHVPQLLIRGENIVLVNILPV